MKSTKRFVSRDLRNRVNIAMRAAKAEYINNQLEYNRENNKTFRNIIHSEILAKTSDNFFILKTRKGGKSMIKTNY